MFFVKHLVASTTALVQTIFQLPPSRFKHSLWVFAIWPILMMPKGPGGVLPSFIDENDIALGPLHGLPVHHGPHPVEILVQESRAKFQSMLNSQSKTYEEAVAEYCRRYNNMDPPPGFDAWFQFAKEKNSLIIDEFDTIFDFVYPFLRLPPRTIRRYMDEAMGPRHIARCRFRGGKLEGDCGPRGKTIQNMTAPFQHALPDLDLLINSHDEPTVLLSSPSGDDAIWEDHSNTNVRRYITRPCGSDRPRWSTTTRQVSRNVTSALPFIQDILESRDVCAHPEYADMHGYFMSPPSFQIATKPVPILSQAKLSTFSDMLMPSQIYLRGYNNLNDYGYVDDNDPEWEQKDTKLYWIGSNTGGADFDSSWHDMHRQRFVTMTEPEHDDFGTAAYLNESSSGVWVPWRGLNELSTLSNVHFHAIRICAWTECKAQMKYFHTSDRQPQTEQYRYKFVMDLDGNSYSGRFYSHLRSRSLSLKMTIFQEWHDDRLFPWVHYVPVSLSMDELPELVRFLVTERGFELGKEIADSGREWWGKLLRVEDFQIYFYRLLLELARILDEKRAVS